MKKYFSILIIFLLLNNASFGASVGNMPGGFCYTGIGGPAYDGIGGPCYDGIGGPAYDGIGGPCYDGIGGPAYSGFGGPCYKTLTGFAGDCPKACRCKACKK